MKIALTWSHLVRNDIRSYIETIGKEKNVILIAMDLSQKKRYKGEIKTGQCYPMGTRGGKRKLWSLV